MIGLIQLLAIGFACYALALIVYTMWSLSHPHRQTYASAISRSLAGDPSELDVPISFEEGTIQGSRGELCLWIIQGTNPKGPSVLMTHGWGSSRQGGLKRLAPFIANASQIVLWDLPGHGDSTGITHLGADEHHDLMRVYESTRPVDDLPTILFGWSMGAGVGLAFADAYGDSFPIAGIICESPYIAPITPARNVIALRGVPHRLNLRPTMWALGILFGVGPRWRGFARDERVKSLDLPILILHGQRDPVSPIDDGEQLAQSCPTAKLATIEGGGHNNLWTDPLHAAQMCDAIVGFMNSLNKSSDSVKPVHGSSQTAAPAQP